MKIDLLKLNNYNHLDVDSDLLVDADFYRNTDIRSIKHLHITGSIDVDINNDIVANLFIQGILVLPCAVSLLDVDYEIATNIEENIGNFNYFYDNKQKELDILPFIWENIVSEVPIRVVKEGASAPVSKGDGWELVSDD